MSHIHYPEIAQGQHAVAGITHGHVAQRNDAARQQAIHRECRGGGHVAVIHRDAAGLGNRATTRNQQFAIRDDGRSLIGALTGERQRAGANLGQAATAAQITCIEGVGIVVAGAQRHCVGCGRVVLQRNVHRAGQSAKGECMPVHRVIKKQVAAIHDEGAVVKRGGIC